MRKNNKIRRGVLISFLIVISIFVMAASINLDTTDLKVGGTTAINSSRAADFTQATISGDLTVDTNVLKVDTTNDKVGIGTASPSAKLDVDGNAYVEDIRVYKSDRTSHLDIFYNSMLSEFCIGGGGVSIGDGTIEAAIKIYDSVPTAQILLTSDSNDSSYIDGCEALGVGTKTPSEMLDVDGAVNSSDGYKVDTNSAIDGDGFFIPVSCADGSAPNNSIYYSTTSSKLVYKDSGGSVHDLY